MICDQVEAATGKGIVKREITRVLTPGTVVEEAYLEPQTANFLVAAWTKGAESGLAAADISTGEMLLCQLPADRLDAELSRLEPAELLQPPTVEAYRFDPERGRQRLRQALGITFEDSVGAGSAPLAVGAAGVLLEYLQTNQVTVGPGVFRVRTYSPDAAMQLDAPTVRNLELDALTRLVDRTATPIGARRLRAWLKAPLRDVEAIQLRLGAVDELVRVPVLESRLRQALSAVGDLERLTSRAVQGHAAPRELVALRRSLEGVPTVQAALSGVESLALKDVALRLDPQPELARLLAEALVDDPPSSQREAGAVRPGYDGQLDGIREASRSAREWIAGLEAAERQRTGIKSLKVGYNRVFGYYIEVSAGAVAHVPQDYVRKQTLTGAERYLTPELKEREAIVLNAQQDMMAREVEVLKDVSGRVAESAALILASAEALGEADALQSLADAARDLDWCRPEVNEGLRLAVAGGRHPLVEAALPAGTFVPNDLLLDPDCAQVVI